MNDTDKKRFSRSITEALDGLKQDAHCYCYGDEPEYTHLIELIEGYQQLLVGNEKDKEYEMK